MLGAGGSSAETARIASPSLASSPTVGFTLAPARDRVLAGGRRALAEAGWWGGPVTNNRGETFKLYVSDEYGVDEAARVRWANFLGWALHGKELSKLTAYQAPVAQVQLICGSEDVLGCYFIREQKLIFPGDARDPSEGSLNPAEVLLHEYGHHIANNRRNDPWPAIDWGPKRWASFENICKRADKRTVRPGDQGRYYLLNPGEAFADTYRLLNVQRAQKSNAEWYRSWGEPLPFQWQLFSRTDETLEAVERDVLKPWTGPRVIRWAGRTPRKPESAFGILQTDTRVSKRRVFTGLDGTITVTLKSAPKGSFLTIERGLGMDLEARKSITTTVCGESSLRLKVSTVVPRGKFRVVIHTP